MSIRNRIKDHRRVRAGDLLPHEFNWREHPDQQRAALSAIYDEVGFARSLLAFELPDGRLKLIDGHLRRDIDPEMMVDVEVLDVDEIEARKLLLTMDTLAGLADANDVAVETLLKSTPSDSRVLNELWRSISSGSTAVKQQLDKAATAEEQFLILVECTDEQHQVTLLQRFFAEDLTCRALVS